MAYTHSKYEVFVKANMALGSTGDKAYWSPGYIPHIIRAVALVITNAIGSSTEVRVDLRPTAGSDTGRGDGDIAALLSSSLALGKVLYKDGINVRVNPGEEAVFQVTNAGEAADEAHAILYVEPTWELPANNDAMVATA